MCKYRYVCAHIYIYIYTCLILYMMLINPTISWDHWGTQRQNGANKPQVTMFFSPCLLLQKMSGQKYDPIQTGLGPYGLIFASSLLEVQQKIVAAIRIKVVLFHSAFWPWNFRYTFILTTIYILYGFHNIYIYIHPQSTCTVPKWIKRLTVGVSFNKNWRHSSQDPHPWPNFCSAPPRDSHHHLLWSPH